MQLHELLLENALGGRVDEMVELVEQAKPFRGTTAGRTIRRIAYHTISNIPDLLRGDRQHTGVPTNGASFVDMSRVLVTGDPANISRPAHETSNDDDKRAGIEVDQGGSDNTQEEEADHPHAESEDEADSLEPFGHNIDDQSGLTADEGQQIHLQLSLTGQELVVVRKAVRHYQRTHATAIRRTFNKQTMLLASYFKAFLIQAEHDGWRTRSYYRKLYLWSCPHIFSALHGVHKALLTERNSLKEQFAKAKTDHLKYDDLIVQMNELK